MYRLDRSSGSFLMAALRSTSLKGCLGACGLILAAHNMFMTLKGSNFEVGDDIVSPDCLNRGKNMKLTAKLTMINLSDISVDFSAYFMVISPFAEAVPKRKFEVLLTIERMQWDCLLWDGEEKKEVCQVICTPHIDAQHKAAY
uniref:Uncharacterized protein n=1 Tax=Glossina pallidipes TaxID=7398 RepID=A0A1A9ZHV4_GLOPL